MPAHALRLFTLFLLLSVKPLSFAQSAPHINFVQWNPIATSADMQCAVGTGFGGSWGSVTVNDEFVGAFSWSDTQVCVQLPTDITSGAANLQLTTFDAATSNVATFTVVPGPNIASVTPSSGHVGDQVTLTGSNFGVVSNGGLASFFGSDASIVSWSDSQVVITIPDLPNIGNLPGAIFANGAWASFTFHLLPPPPSIASISPSNGPLGSKVNIAGSHFGAAQPVVTFNGLNAILAYSDDNNVTAYVPAGATPGNIVLTSGENQVSNSIAFTVTPLITSLSPNTGGAGTSVTIKGNNFGASQAGGTVLFNALNAVISAWTDTSVTVTAPKGVISSNVVVVRGDGFSSNAGVFANPAGPMIQINVADTPLNVDLTSTQNLDWIHWGRISADIPDRKAGVTPLISNYQVIGNDPVFSSYESVTFAWKDGNQQAVVPATVSNLMLFGNTSMLQITVPADTTVKTLNLYADVAFGQMLVQASLSDGSSPSVIDQTVIDSSRASKIYSIDFRAASAGQTLTVTLTGGTGSETIGLEAATLSRHLPIVAVTSPAGDAQIEPSTEIAVNADAIQYDAAIVDVTFKIGTGIVLDQNTPPFTMTLDSLPQGHYSVGATAKDATNLSNTSVPVEFDVVGAGGLLSLQTGAPDDVTDLTADGTTDWVLWGWQNPNSDAASLVFDRKAGITPVIPNLALIGNELGMAIPAGGSGSNTTPLSFTYADGWFSNPTPTQGMVILGNEAGHGFEISLPADTTLRRFRLYCAVNLGRAKIRAFLSDGSAVPVSDDSLNSPSTSLASFTLNYSNAVYSIDYRAASPGQTLTVRYTLEESFGEFSGGIMEPVGELIVMAATLSGAPATPLSPTVSNVRPRVGYPEANFTVTGSGFGAIQSDTALTVGGVPAAISSWSDTQIVASVPWLNPGVYSISLYGVVASDFLVVDPPTPQITGINPQEGAAGTIVTINGAGFGANASLSAGWVTLNGSYIPSLSWTDTVIRALIPVGATTGPIVVNSDQGVPSNEVPFMVLNPTGPVILSVSPSNGSPGTVATLKGVDFGSSGTVSFSGQPATVFSWSDTSIAVGVPYGANSGDVVVSTGQGTSNSITFVVAPTVTGLSASSGVPGTHVTITGSNFGGSQGTGSVRIGGVLAQAVTWTDTSIEFVLPNQAATGNVVVTADNKLNSNPATFIIDSSGPLLQLSISDAPLQVNLTSPQVLDWIHWGRIAANLSDRKALDTPLIGDYTPVNGAEVAPFFGTIGFSWSDGNFLPTASEVSTDVETFSTSGGFQITVPADTTAKTLNLYAEVFFGQAILQASLSDGSTASITDQSVIDSDLGNKVYSISFRAASPGQTLTITLTSTASSGGVGIQAVTLTQGLPFVSTTAPASEPAFLASTPVPGTVTAHQIDNPPLTLHVTGSNGSSFDASTAPFDFSWDSLQAGHYTTSATATDANGLSSMSLPTQFDVIGQGGSLSLLRSDVPATSFEWPIDVSVEGTADWILWGPLDTGDLEENRPGNILARKELAKPLISSYKLIGNHRITAGMFVDNILFANADRLYFGGSDVQVPGQSSGFEITVAADPTPHALQLYVEASSARARLTAFLSDGSAPVVADNSFDFTTSSDPNGYSGTALYTISFRAASAGQTLTVRYTLDYDYGSGNIGLIGATLDGDPVQPPPPAPQITSINPSTSPVNTQVTISGTNFGSNQAGGSVLFLQTAAQVVNWSDTSIVVYVPDVFADGNGTQVVVVTPNGTSNAVNFQVPTYQFFPPTLSIAVGQVTTVTAKDSNRQPVTGLSWGSTNLAIVSVSADGFITGVSPGSATVYGGDVPLPVTVYPGPSLPPGTVVWSVPSSPGASFISSLAPAVPSDSGADVFTYDDTRYLSAISADGEPIWRQYVGAPTITFSPGDPASVNSMNRIVPDFAGKALLHSLNVPNFQQDGCHSTQKITAVGPSGVQDIYTFSEKITPDFACTAPDGVQGVLNLEAPDAVDAGGIQTEIPHPAGVLFVQDKNKVILIDSTTQQPFATFAAENSTFNGAPVSTFTVGRLIIAGDGNGYLPYSFNETTYSSPRSNVDHYQVNIHVNVLRISPDGSSAKINLSNWSYDVMDDHSPEIPGVDPSVVVLNQVTHETYSSSGTAISYGPAITNADVGVAIAAPVDPGRCADSYIGTYFTKGADPDHPDFHTISQFAGCPDFDHQHTQLAFVAQDALTSQVDIATQSFTPYLQRADGSYIGTSTDSNTGLNVVAVQADGTMPWSKPAAVDAIGRGIPVTPLYATADSGVVVTSTSVNSNGGTQLGSLYKFDQNGNVTGQTADSGAMRSWSGNSYSGTSALSKVALYLGVDEGSFWSSKGGNASNNFVAISDCPCVTQSDPADPGLEAEAAPSETVSPEEAALNSGTIAPQADLVEVAFTLESAFTDALFVGPACPLCGLQSPSCTTLAGDKPTQLILIGDQGRNNGPGHNWNVGALFKEAAQTLANSYQAAGLQVVACRISSVTQFNLALTGQLSGEPANFKVDGEVTFFGHGGRVTVGGNDYSAVFIGETPGEDTNLYSGNVNKLSNAALGSKVVVTINACHGAEPAPASVSIAESVSQQLHTEVHAYNVPLYFSHHLAQDDPFFDGTGRTVSGLPIYMIPAGPPHHKPGFIPFGVSAR